MTESTNKISLEEVGAMLATLLTDTSNNREIFTQMSLLHNLLAAHYYTETRDVSTDENKSQTKGNNETDPYIQSAPSLLACLEKLLAIDRQTENARLLQSVPIRNKWVSSILLLHQIYPQIEKQQEIVKHCMDIISTKKILVNAASIRRSAIELMAALFSTENEVTTKMCVPWMTLPFEIVQCVQSKAYYKCTDGPMRASCVDLVQKVVRGCIIAQSKLKHVDYEREFLNQDAVAEKTLVEVIKVLKRASDDKASEVRLEAAKLASVLAPVLAVSPRAPRGRLSPKKATAPSLNLTYLEDVFQVSLKNVDDGSPGVAAVWSQAVARCLCAAIRYGELFQQESSTSSSNHNNDIDGDNEAPTSGGSAAASGSSRTSTSSNDILSKLKAFSENKKILALDSCLSLSNALDFLVDNYIKTGGELVSIGCGGAYSVGGRAARVGLSHALIHLLRLQIGIDSDFQKGSSKSSAKQISLTILNMVGPTFERQLQLTDAYASSTFEGEREGPSSSMAPKPGALASATDAALARLAVNRVLRFGLSEVLSEPTQQSLLQDLAEFCLPPSKRPTTEQKNMNVTQHQLQCALIELGHLVTTLGDAVSGLLDHIVPAVKLCLSHSEYGVRYEAAIAFAAIAFAVPRECTGFVQDLMDEVRSNNDAITDLSRSRTPSRRPVSPVPKNRSKSRRSLSPTPSGKYVTYQYSLHGNAVALSMILHESFLQTNLLSDDNLFDLVGVAEILVLYQFDEKVTMGNPGAACTCVRAGYSILSAALASGPDIAQHVERIVKCWTRTTKCIVDGTKHFSPAHDIICLEAAVSSVVSFLRFCSEFLLSMSGTLNRITLVLESMLGLIIPEGRLGAQPGNTAAESRLDNVKAALFEAFSWLPPGCFPVASEKLFLWAIEHIQDASETDVTTSLLPSLVSPEDNIMSARSINAATSYSHVGDLNDLADNFVFLSSNLAEHRERESAMHAPLWRNHISIKLTEEDYILQSIILGPSKSRELQSTPPTPLHKVGLGTLWKEPPSPAPNSKIRLVDASIHVFSSVFGLFEGGKQERAMIMLGELLPASLRSGGKFNVGNALMTDSERKVKNKQENIFASNLSATLLAVTQALHLHEASTSTDKGPPWMRRARDMLFVLLSSPYDLVRRASAECLATLALSTRGMGGGIHGFQQTIIDSLEEIISGNMPNGKPRKAPQNILADAKAAALFSLACFQRHSYKFSMSLKSSAKSSSKNSDLDFLILSPLNMKIRTILLANITSLTCDPGSFTLAIYGVHSLTILTINSAVDKVNAYGGASELKKQRTQYILKVVDTVEALFLTLWIDMAGGYEIALVSALARLLTCLLHDIVRLKEEYPDLLEKVCLLAISSAQLGPIHPTVQLESLAFIEKVARLFSIEKIPEFFMQYIMRTTPAILDSERACAFAGNKKYVCIPSKACLAADLTCLRAVFDQRSTIPDDNLFPRIYIHLDESVGKRQFTHFSFWRSVVARESERSFFDRENVISESTAALNSFLLHSNSSSKYNVLKALIFAKAIIVGSVNMDDSVSIGGGTSEVDQAKRDAFRDAAFFLSQANAPRWQTKTHAVKLAMEALKLVEPTHVDTYIIEESITAACTASQATSCNAELPELQSEGIRLLCVLMELFGDSVDKKSGHLLLQQFSSQIIPAVKHGLTCADDNRVLFCLACKLLRLLARKGVISDGSVLRRLIRPIIKSAKGELEMADSCLYDICTSRIVVLAELYYLSEAKLLDEPVGAAFLKEISSVKLQVATSSLKLATSLTGSMLCEDEGEGFSEKSVLGFLTFLAVSESTHVQKAAPLLFVEIYDFLAVLKDDVNNIDVMDSISVAIHGIKNLVQSDFFVNGEQWCSDAVNEICNLCKELVCYCVVPILSSNHDSTKHCAAFVEVSCALVEAASALDLKRDDDVLLYTVLFPLSSMEPLTFSEDTEIFTNAIASLLKSAHFLLASRVDRSDDASIVRAIFQLVSGLIGSQNIQTPTIIKERVSEILRFCVSSQYTNQSDMLGMVFDAANSGQWDLWLLLCSFFEDDSCIACSISAMQNALSNISDDAILSLALSAICSSAKTKSSSISVLMHGLGSQILLLLQKHGTIVITSNVDGIHLRICRDCITILSLAFQNLASQQTEQLLMEFFQLCLNPFIAIINQNGLPNQPKGEGDANKGRLCAAVLVHWARASPTVFKACLANLSETERGMVEFAVRSEMTGYAVNKKPTLFAR